MSAKAPVGLLMIISESTLNPSPDARIWTSTIDPPMIIGCNNAWNLVEDTPTSGLLWKSRMLVQP